MKIKKHPLRVNHLGHPITMLDKVVRAFVTVKEMLSDRGVDISLLDGYSDEEIRAMCRQMTIFAIPINDESTLIFDCNPKFRINSVRKFKEDSKYIIVFRDKINNANLRHLRSHMPGAEVFHLQELLYNVSKHSYVPKHEIVSDPEEVASIMKTYDIRHKTQLPVILRTDAMARYLDIKSGDLVRITRSSPTAGVSVSYRMCM